MIQKYSLTTRVIHWLMAALILFMLGLGIYMKEFLPSDAPNHLQIYSFHKSLGVSILLLTIIRIANRFNSNIPPLPETMPKWEKTAAHLGHFGLYALMFLVPLSGYLMSNAFGFPVYFFLIEMPMIIERNLELGKIFAETHEILSYCFLAIIFGHVLAVVKHRFFDRPEHNVWRRMF